MYMNRKKWEDNDAREMIVDCEKQYETLSTLSKKYLTTLIFENKRENLRVIIFISFIIFFSSPNMRPRTEAEIASIRAKQ